MADNFSNQKFRIFEIIKRSFIKTLWRQRVLLVVTHQYLYFILRWNYCFAIQ